MRVEHERTAFALAFENADDARSPGLRFNFPDIQTGTIKRLLDIFANLGLSRATRHQRGVDGIDAYQIRQRADHIGAVDRDAHAGLLHAQLIEQERKHVRLLK